MLHQEILQDKALKLLKELMGDSELQGFNLVGGIALSLYLGHRLSVDLDLFSQGDFDVARLHKHLTGKYGFAERFIERQTLKGDIDGVFIDCIKYDYPQISTVNSHDGIRITSIPDLLAMKISAITDSGEREKDFVDVAFFSTMYSLDEMLNFYSSKFHRANTIIPLKALLYFDDIRRNEPLILTRGIYEWGKIEDRLHDMVENPSKVFSEFPVRINPEIKRIEMETAKYAMEHITGKGLHTGFPWLRDSFVKLCGEVISAKGASEALGDTLKRVEARRIVDLCSQKLGFSQIVQLEEKLNKIITGKLVKGKGMKR